MFYAGLSAGIGQAQGEHNNKMMDFINQKSQTMAQLYGHLADTVISSGGDQGIASEFLNRSKGWATTNPLFDPKGYKALLKGEKTGMHDMVQSANQRKIAEYNNKTFGSQSTGSQASPAPQDDAYKMPSVQDLMGQVSGGQPIYGELGVPTGVGKAVLSAVPEILQKRMEMQFKRDLLEHTYSSGPGGMDKRSPTGSASYSEQLRAMGLNVPVTQWRPINRALYLDDNGEYKLEPAQQSYRDGSTWIRTGPGQEKEVTPVDENPQVERAPDGSLWAKTVKGPIRLGTGNLPIQSGSSETSVPTPGGGTAKKSKKNFTQPPPNPVPSGDLTVGTLLPPGLHTGENLGPPKSRTSTGRPSEAYKTQQGSFSLEKLETSSDQTDRQIAAYITHPESFDASSTRREMWNNEFFRRTNGAISQAPVPLREFRTDFAKQRMAIVNGFHASKNIGNILSSTDGQLVGLIAGRWVQAMNTLGSSSAIAMLNSSDNLDPSLIKSILPQLSQERPELAHRIGSNGDLLATKAADLITSMRLFNVADVKNTIGGVQGVSKMYDFLKNSLMDPRMDLPLVLGHLGSINRNMADGMLTLEQARWGTKIPYIREKELMSQIYWDPHTEQLIDKYRSAAAEKGSTLSRQDAIFLLWRNGKIEADPGNFVDVQRSPSKD